MLFLSGEESHQKRVSADWILAVRLIGSLKQLIEYAGIALAWKKPAEKPSGPGAFPWCIEKTAAVISSGDGVAIRVSFISFVTLGIRAFSTVASASRVEVTGVTVS